MIQITSTTNGFRRCGIVHSTDTVEYPDSAFIKEQLAMLQAEPQLIVKISKDKK